MLLYAVSDRAWSNSDEEFLSQAKQAIKSGVTIFQLREKHTSYEHFREFALKLKPICKQYNVPLIINDNVKLAKEIDADGVHLGQDDLDIKAAREYLGANKIIGVSAHNVKEALEAENGGADYLGSGAVFGSSTKTDAKPMDHAVLAEICASVSIPVVAIGGITADNVEQLEGRGMAGVAVVSGIFACPDIEAGTKHLRALVDEIL